MTTSRVMGIETEYGISVAGQSMANPMVASSQIVNAYASYASQPGHAAADRGKRARWDFEEENPLRDARGFELPREASDHGDDDLGLANVILTNGARLYV